MLTKVIMPTNKAEPMDPAMVRKDVSRDDASATFFGSTLLVPPGEQRHHQTSDGNVPDHVKDGSDPQGCVQG